MYKKSFSMLDPATMKSALVGAVKKLHPSSQFRNPVMFVVYVGSILTTALFVQSLVGEGEAPPSFIFAVAAWLWATLFFANFSEAMAEGRGKAQAATLREMRTAVHAKLLVEPKHHAPWENVLADELRKGDVVLIEAGDMVPCDGEVIEGVASVDESAITGESAPVIREAGGDFSSVTGGTRVLSDWLVVRVAVDPGESFL